MACFLGLADMAGNIGIWPAIWPGGCRDVATILPAIIIWPAILPAILPAAIFEWPAIYIL